MISKLTINKFERNLDKKEGDIVTKFGGQPDWLTVPQWPISEGWDCPMMFVAQIVLDERLFQVDQKRVAYLFVTHKESPKDTFFEPDIIDPDGGENAIIIQPDGEVFTLTKEIINGPTLFDKSGEMFQGYPSVKLESDPDFINSDDFDLLPENDKDQYFDAVDGDKIGGTPIFFQGDDWPEGGDEKWQLLLQLNSNFLPFDLNLGGSPTMFALVSKDLKEGKIVIQDM